MKMLLAKIAAGSVALASLAFAIPAAQAATPGFDTTGHYVFAMTYLGTDYNHNVSLTQNSAGNITGFGTSTPYTWTITSGSVSGSAISFDAKYTATADAVTPLTTMHITGTIASDGTMSGNWSDNYQGNARTGAWKTTSGTAKALTYYALSYSAGAHGTLTGSTSQSVVAGANGTAVTAVPDSGYHFVKWSDNLLANPRTDLNVASNISVTANFAANVATKYTLTYNAAAHGTLTGSTTQMVNSGASGSAVAAVADSGYHFVKWSDGSTANPRTDTNVLANLSVTAKFAADVVTPPTGDKNDCKKGGWIDLLNRFGIHFKNQGKCVSSFVKHQHDQVNVEGKVHVNVKGKDDDQDNDD